VIPDKNNAAAWLLICITISALVGWLLHVSGRIS